MFSMNSSRSDHNCAMTSNDAMVSVANAAAIGDQNLAHTGRSLYGNTIAWERVKQPRVLHSEMGARVSRVHEGAQSTAGQASRLPAALYSALPKPKKFLQRFALAGTREFGRSGPDDLRLRARS